MWLVEIKIKSLSLYRYTERHEATICLRILWTSKWAGDCCRLIYRRRDQQVTVPDQSAVGRPTSVHCMCVDRRVKYI